jgi:cytochrome c oxidase subunit IV
MSSIKDYLTVTIGLLGLLLLTVGAAYIHFGPLNTAIAMLISSAKASLIILFFMHVRRAKPLLRVFVFAGFLWLTLLFALTLGDYLSR